MIAAADAGLARRAWRANAGFLIALWVVLFVPAWTLHYWQAWLYWLVFAILQIAGTVYLLRRDPKLIERRLSAGPAAEQEASQKIIMTVASVCFALTFIVPGLDRHFGWSHVPPWLALLGGLGVLLGYAFIYAVVRENSYAASTIRVEQAQPVISTGPYALVRHPMYSGALVMSGLTPLALGSYWGLLLFFPLAGILAWRLLDEERYLARNLPGYDAYCRATRYRLMPGLW
jgi:protein-S-isoprenylcysteine O-methyltransferase Ste14